MKRKPAGSLTIEDKKLINIRAERNILVDNGLSALFSLVHNEIRLTVHQKLITNLSSFPPRSFTQSRPGFFLRAEFCLSPLAAGKHSCLV